MDCMDGDECGLMKLGFVEVGGYGCVRRCGLGWGDGGVVWCGRRRKGGMGGVWGRVRCSSMVGGMASSSTSVGSARSTSVDFVGKTGLMLVNIGTPASLKVRDVRRYLREFLGDRRVVDINPIVKFLLLNLVVLPFRPKESAEAYANVWDAERGSPLIYHTEDMATKLRERLGEKFDVQLGMQFGEPSITSALTHFRRHGIDRIVVLPMFPQYASSSTGSAAEMVYKQASKIYATPYLHIVPAFFDSQGYVKPYAEIIRREVGEGCANYDMLLMSFHGVPQTHCTRTDETGMHCMKIEGCCSSLTQANRNCYRAQCFSSARKIAELAGIPEDKYTVAFQSRLSAAGPAWIRPYTDEVLVQLAQKGVKKLAAVVPSFTADCLETLEEIGIRGKEDFIAAGGEEFTLIPCLNSDDVWIDGLIDIIKESCPLESF